VTDPETTASDWSATM